MSNPCRIKKQRQMATQATAHIAPGEDTVLLTDANKPKHFNR
jgi:hypothetical protein